MAPPVAGYKAWYDASQITGQADGSSLASWPDLSGNSFTLTQPTGTAQPTYYSSTAGKTVNGLPAVWFDGGDGLKGAFTQAQPATMFAVYALAASTGGAQFVVDCANRVILGYNGNAVVYAGSYVTDGVLAVDGAVHVQTGIVDGVGSAVRFDGGTWATGNAGSNSFGDLWLSSLDGFSPVNGPICEVLIYPGHLTAPDVASVESYLNNKWLVASAATAARAAVVAPSGAAIRSSSW